MLYSERVVASMAEWLVFLFQQVAVCYPCVTNSESGHDSLLFAVKWLSCVAQTLLDLDVIRKVCFWFRCSRVPARLCKCMYLLWV